MSTATLPQAARLPGASSPWIAGPVTDFLLFFGTPLVVLPAVLLALTLAPASRLSLLVAAFGAVAHHLPGMMRAYGDRALFERWRTRFIVAPVFLLATCTWLHFTAASLLTLLVYAWGVWHGFMQLHGFVRIYDGKRGITDALTARLDQVLAASWFLAAVLHSPTRVHYVIEAFYFTGGPVVPLPLVEGARTFSSVLAGAATLAWGAHLAWTWARGLAPSVLKIATLASGLAFFWYVNVSVESLLVGVVLFELFHDAQYLGIVWLFNRRRVTADPEVGAFTAFLFRPKWWLALLYVGLCWAYGTFYLAGKTLPESTFSRSLLAIAAASTLLHFYYDGFIWKMKDADNRAALGIAGSRAARAGLVTPGFAHAAKWGLFVAPIVLLYPAWMKSPLPDRARVESLAAISPTIAVAQLNLATELAKAGDAEGALAASERAASLPAKDEKQRHDIEVALAWHLVDAAQSRLAAGRAEEARPLLARVLALNPRFADLLSDAGAAKVRAGRDAEALADFETAVLMAPDHVPARLNLAATLLRAGRLDEARAHALQAAALSAPGDPRPGEVLAAIDAAALR